MTFGRLERTQAPQPMSEINMTPLVDVMLVLLVIFIITAPLLVNSIPVTLPKAQGGAAQGAPRVLAITIDTAGQYYLDKQAQTPEQLALALKQAAQHNPLTEIQLRADTAVPYGRVVEVMGLAHKAGLTRLGFVAETPAASAN